MTDACRLSRWTETYLDGELSPEHTVDFEDHLADCYCCRDKLKFEQALRFSMRRTVRVATFPTSDFEQRIRAAMAAARETTPEPLESPAHAAPVAAAPSAPVLPLHSRPLTWRAIAPLSVAAAAALVFAAVNNIGGSSNPSNDVMASMGSRASSQDTTRLVREFMDQLATDTEHHPDDSATLVEENEPPFIAARPPTVVNVGHRHLPLAELSKLGAIWEGLHYRYIAAHGRIPSLHYRIGGHRVLVWAYDSERTPLRMVLEPDTSHNRPVFVGTHHGLAMAAVEHSGRGYVATTDLSPSEAAEVVVTAAVR